MMNWLVRIVLSLAGVVAAWFVAPESDNFDIVQMAIALFVVVFFVAIAAFWPTIVKPFKREGENGRRTDPRRDDGQSN